MQPASGFKETSASLKNSPLGGNEGVGSNIDGGHSGGAGTNSVTEVPVSEHYGLGYLGASLGNQAFHSVASANLEQQRNQHAQRNHWTPEVAAQMASGGTQRFQQLFRDRIEQMQNAGQGSEASASFPTSVMRSLADGQTVPHPLDLDPSQEEVFRKHPELFKQFQQQAAHIMPRNRDSAAQKSEGPSAAHSTGSESTDSGVDGDASAVMRALGL